jgi:hypothetical protein
LPRLSVGNWRVPTRFYRPFSIQPATRVQFGLGTVLQYSITPSLRTAGFEDEDDDDDEDEALKRLGRLTRLHVRRTVVQTRRLPLSMIRIELPTLIFIYLYLAVIVIGGLWFLDSWRSQKRKKQALRYTVRCTICASIFEDKTNEPLPRCPRCGCLNERRNFGGL